MQNLTHYLSGHCAPLTEEDLLSPETLMQVLAHLPGWEAEGDGLTKTFGFKNFHETMAFVNAVAGVANQQDHHPEVQFGYKNCTVSFSTHSAGGVTRNDTLCAAAVNALFDEGFDTPE